MDFSLAVYNVKHPQLSGRAQVVSLYDVDNEMIDVWQGGERTYSLVRVAGGRCPLPSWPELAGECSKSSFC
jgi:hypothetical protein